MKKWLDFRLIVLSLMIIATAVNIFLLVGIDSDKALASESFKVTVLTTPDCGECFDLSPLTDYFEEAGIKKDDFTELAYDSRKAKKLIKKYDIVNVPTVLVEGNVENAQFITDLVEAEAGGYPEENIFLLKRVQPPFIDIETNEVNGKFDIVYLTDETCTECYDVNLHRESLDRLVMKPQNETIVDINSEQGQIFVEEYFITVIPTILLTGDLDDYQQFQEVWDQVGTKEEDGTHVLRRGVVQMGTYKQLPDGEIINPNESEEENQ